MQYKKLFTPGKIGNVEIKNRIVMPPMMLGFGQFDGRPTEKMMNYYEARARGGAGLIVTEITRVNDFSGASAFAQLAISHDYHIAPLKEMIDRIHRHGAKMFIQLHHPGRQNIGLMMGTVPLSIAMERIMGKAYDRMFYKVAPFGKKLMEKDLVLKTWAPSKSPRAYSAESKNREMSVHEIKKIIHRSSSQTEKIELDVKVGDKVRIISGPFAEFIGDISEVYPDKSKLRAMVSIFGRETPVELEYKQIQKV